MLKKIINLGITDKLFEYEQRRVKLLNAICFIAPLISISGLPFAFLYNPTPHIYTLLITISCLIFYSSLFFNSRRHYLIAKINSQIATLFIFIQASLFTPGANIFHLFLIVMAIFPFFIFSRWEKLYLLIFVGFATVSFILLEVRLNFQLREYIDKIPDLYGRGSYTLRGFLYFSVLIICYLMSRIIDQMEEDIEKERRKSERLLLNILPAKIASMLKEESSHSIVNRFSEAGILFADIVGFTALTEELGESELIKILDDIFSEFDLIAERYNIEKIKTIGDSYMAAAGIPEPVEDPSDRIAMMALDIREIMESKISKKYKNVKIRIGIHSGPVIAGIIGRKKFLYDLWSDSVNIASRMESHGSENRIHTTGYVYEQLKERYDFEYRGKIEVKGKGEMDTYYLLKRKKRGPQTQSKD